MNARRTISPAPSARNYVEHYATYTGRIKHPVLTLHTVVDTLVPVQHEAAYAALRAPTCSLAPPPSELAGVEPRLVFAEAPS